MTQKSEFVLQMDETAESGPKGKKNKRRDLSLPKQCYCVVRSAAGCCFVFWEGSHYVGLAGLKFATPDWPKGPELKSFTCLSQLLILKV